MIEKDYGDREARELWPQLERNLPGFFKDVEVKPALLHGDLWGGNVAENDEGPGKSLAITFSYSLSCLNV